MKNEAPTGTNPHDALARMMMTGVIDDTGSRAATPVDWPRPSMVWPTGLTQNVEGESSVSVARTTQAERGGKPLTATRTTRQVCTDEGIPYSTVSKLLAKHASVADRYSLRISPAANALRRWRSTDFLRWLVAVGVEVPAMRKINEHAAHRR